MTDHAADQSGPIAVAGATGFVGRHLVRALLDAGHRVRGLTRSADKARAVLPGDLARNDRLEIVEGDALGEGVAERLVEGASAAINLIGIIREASGRQTFERVHTKTTAALVIASERAGVRRYLQMSALGVSAHGETEYHRTKWAAEEAVRLSRLDWTIFRPGLIHGPDGEFMKMTQSWVEGKSVPFMFAPYFSRVRFDTAGALPRPVVEAPAVAPVHVDDVAAAFVAALGSEAAFGETYPLVGSEELGFDEMLRTVRDGLPLGRTGMPVVGVPGDLAALKARAMEFVGLGSLLPFDAGMALMGRSDSVADVTKAREDLGFEPRGFSESFAGYAAQM